MSHLKEGIHIIPTPIGNLKDITLRALEVLEQVDVIFCEDTRVTQKLLSHYGVKKKLYIYNDYSSEKDRIKILEKAKKASVGLVSDAGMPLISDPGFKLVRQAREENINVCVLPGACSLINAVVSSSFPTNHFSFLGFFDEKKALRNKNIEGSLIFFISPHQLDKTMVWLFQNFSDRKIALCKEISKAFETVSNFKNLDCWERYKSENLIKGEFVLVLSPPIEKKWSDDEINTLLEESFSKKNPKFIIDDISKKYEIPKKRIYKLYLNKKENFI